MPRIKTCTCGETIAFYPTEASGGEKEMPLDIEPNPDGNVIIVQRDGKHFARVLTKAGTTQLNLLDDQPDHYMPHFATCDKREDFKR